MALHAILFKQSHVVLEALQVPVARKQTRSRYDGGPCLGEHCGHFVLKHAVNIAAASSERLGGTTGSLSHLLFLRCWPPFASSVVPLGEVLCKMQKYGYLAQKNVPDAFVRAASGRRGWKSQISF